MKQIFLLLSVEVNNTTPISWWSELPDAYDVMKLVGLNWEQSIKLLNDLNYFDNDNGVGYYFKQCFEGNKI